MKKKLAVFLLSAALINGFISNSLFAQSSEDDVFQQVLIPKEVYVGDTACIEYTFRSPVDFFALSPDFNIIGDTLVFDTDNEIFQKVSDRCSVKRAVLLRNGLSYNLVIDLIPWKPGVIDFEEFDLSELCRSSLNAQIDAEMAEATAFFIDLSPITISSIVEHLSVSSLQQPESPILIPGTNYVVWSLIIAAIVLVIIIGVVIVKFQQICTALLTLRKKFGFFRNAFISKSKLKRLLRKKISDVEFAQGWQQIIKDYLEYKFKCPFVSVTGNRLVKVIKNNVAEIFSPEKDEAVLTISNIFARADYIKFADGSIDSRLLPLEEHEAVFLAGEKKSITEKTIKAIVVLESKEEQFDEKKLAKKALNKNLRRRRFSGKRQMKHLLHKMRIRRSKNK